MSELENFRWGDYFLTQGKTFDDFWKTYLKNNKSIFFILGCGFDPRMCDVLEKFSTINENSKIHCFTLDFDEGKASPSIEFADKKNINMKKLQNLESKKISLEIKKLTVRDDSDTIKTRQIKKLFTSLSSFENFTDIVIDIFLISSLSLFSINCKNFKHFR